MESKKKMKNIQQIAVEKKLFHCFQQIKKFGEDLINYPVATDELKIFVTYFQFCRNNISKKINKILI
jgi:hypothetical protein